MLVPLGKVGNTGGVPTSPSPSIALVICPVVTVRSIQQSRILPVFAHSTEKRTRFYKKLTLLGYSKMSAIIL